MGKKVVLATLAAALVSLGGLPRPAAAQNPTLESDLKKDFKLAHLSSDSTGTVVTEKGTVLVVKKGGIRAYPPGDAVVVPNTYKDGALKTAPAKTLGKAGGFLAGHLPGGSTAQQADKGDNSRLLPTDTKVYPTRISVDNAHDKVSLGIIECDSCNNVQQPSSFKAQVDFQFPKGYLNGADAGQLADLITQVLAPDSGGDADGQQQAQQGQDQQQQQAAPRQQKEPQSIERGQTEDQVIAAFGQPDKIVNLGMKKLLIYKDMKVTLIGGKVADVQ